VHEMAIARGIVDIAVAAATREGAQRITRINVVAGELRGIVPLQMTFCFSVVAEGTIASDALLNLELTPIKARCRQCDHTFIVEDHNYVCPDCHGQEVQTVAGMELRVRDIEVE
jgi:hydrogenase nickel incorporation protein HypA/HybF